MAGAAPVFWHRWSPQPELLPLHPTTVFVRAVAGVCGCLRHIRRVVPAAQRIQCRSSPLRARAADQRRALSHVRAVLIRRVLGDRRQAPSDSPAVLRTTDARVRSRKTRSARRAGRFPPSSPTKRHGSDIAPSSTRTCHFGISKFRARLPGAARATSAIPECRCSMRSAASLVTAVSAATSRSANAPKWSCARARKCSTWRNRRRTRSRSIGTSTLARVKIDGRRSSRPCMDSSRERSTEPSEGWKKLIHPEDWPEVKAAIKHAQESGDVAADTG